MAFDLPPCGSIRLFAFGNAAGGAAFQQRRAFLFDKRTARPNDRLTEAVAQAAIQEKVP